MFLSEVWADSHWADAHIQLPEWSDYRADFSLLNGRVYPETLAAERLDRPVDPFVVERDGTATCSPPAGTPEPRQYQPHVGARHLQCRRAMSCCGSPISASWRPR